jgi:biopolymer transport protein ExbB/TolQ
MNFHSFVQTMRAGGITLGVIVGCSILVLAIAIERMFALWRFLDRARNLAEAVKRCLYRGAVAEARAACERSTSLAAEFFLVGFERHGRSTATALEAAVDRERQRVTLALKGQLWSLGTIGATAPFIGLFGTVWGILHAFKQIGLTHQAGIDVVGPGIAEALVTTAAGIVVAIEAVVVYNYFMARLQRTSLELKLMAEEYVELLHEQKPIGTEARRERLEEGAAEAPAPVKTAPTGA